jgi:hypothetical protein
MLPGWPPSCIGGSFLSQDRFGYTTEFKADLREPTSGLEPLTCSLFPWRLRGHRSIERLTLDRQYLVSSLEEIKTAPDDASMRTIASIPLSRA